MACFFQTSSPTRSPSSGRTVSSPARAGLSRPFGAGSGPTSSHSRGKWLRIGLAPPAPAPFGRAELIRMPATMPWDRRPHLSTGVARGNSPVPLPRQPIRSEPAGWGEAGRPGRSGPLFAAGGDARDAGGGPAPAWMQTRASPDRRKIRPPENAGVDMEPGVSVFRQTSRYPLPGLRTSVTPPSVGRNRCSPARAGLGAQSDLTVSFLEKTVAPDFASRAKRCPVLPIV